MTIDEIRQMETTAAAARELMRQTAHSVIKEKLEDLSSLGFHFSLVERAAPEAPAPVKATRQPQRCSICFGAGHRRPQCPQTKDAADIATTIQTAIAQQSSPEDYGFSMTAGPISGEAA